MMTGAGGAVADDGLNHAGVVVRHGDGRITYAYVAFPEERLTGIELLARTGIEQITLPFGGLGAAVCQLEGEGCDVTVCRRRVCQGPSDDDPYWRYFRREPSGVWRPLALGASATEVHDGDIDGWSWTDDEPRLPAVSLAEIARIAGADAAFPGTGQMPPPAVRTILPDGYDSVGDDRQDAVTYAAAGGVIAIVAGGALLAARRSRRLARPAA
jgi:hypothetical protein